LLKQNIVEIQFPDIRLQLAVEGFGEITAVSGSVVSVKGPSLDGKEK